MTKDDLQKVRDFVAEQNLLDNAVYGMNEEQSIALRILDAALAAPEQEPVADRTAWLVELVAGPFAPAWLSAATVENGWTKDANAAISFPSKEVAIDVFERLMKTRRWRSLGLGRDCYKITEHMFIHAAQSCHPAPQPEQEPFAWATFDGEGSYDLRLYECNENYRDDYLKRNGDKYAGWVEPLYRHPAPQSQPVARVTGYYAGRCVIEPLDGKSVFPAGMSVYSAPVAAQSAQPTDCTRIMREQGNPYPRTCPRCKLGPCAYSPTIAITAPPSREWVGLTDEEIEHTINNIRSCEWEGSFNQAFARSIEAALCAKNTGEQA